MLAGCGGLDGGAEVADFTDDIFPLEMTYTVQKSGTALHTLVGTSVVLNLQSIKLPKVSYLAYAPSTAHYIHTLCIMVNQDSPM